MKLLKKLRWWLILLLICSTAGFALNCFVTNKFVFKLDLSLIFNLNTYLFGFEIFLLIASFYSLNWYKNYKKPNSKKIMESKETDKHFLSGLETAHFQSEDEIKQNFSTVEFDDLPSKIIEGIPIKAEQEKNKYPIVFSKPTHTLIIGTTGSGKTTTFINPTIQILANTQTKPSMLVSDPKGELYALHAASLRERGYDIKVLDLRNPYCSVRWNPLEKPFLQYQKMLRLNDEVEINEEEGYYIFQEKKYYHEDEKNAAVQVKKQEIYDEIYEDLHDIVSVLCPVINKSEPIWESGAKNFILAIALAMLEDSENKALGMTVEKFNFYNIMKIATSTQNDCADLENYFKGRSPISKSVSLSKQVLDASDKTRGSYLSTIFDKISIFSDMSICSLTSANEIDFSEIAERPSVLFLQIPDEKETRHTLAAMVILQAYKALVAKANTFKDLSLPRSVYFLLDEFGNLPRIHKLEQMITVGRSRKIWLSLVVQSYAQLSKVYDDKSADIIKSNCNIQIFIGTTDLRTIEDFSKLCGNYSIIQRSASYSTGKSDDLNSSVSVKERPLIYPTELQQLNSPNNMGNAIVNVFGFSPIKSKFTPSFRCTKFKLKNSKITFSAGKFFDEERVFYNLLDRNNLLFPRPKNNLLRKTFNSDLTRPVKTQIHLIPKEWFKGDEEVEIFKYLDEKRFNKAVELLNLIAQRTKEDLAISEQIMRIIERIDELQKNAE